MESFTLSLFLSCMTVVAGLQENHVYGRFGHDKIDLDFIFGDGSMIVTTHAPSDTADEFLRSTSNLHIFETGLVAIRNDVEKICYIQTFDVTEAEMVERVQNALVHGGDLGAVKEERISVAGLEPVPDNLVSQILGEKISNFCNNHLVYILSHDNYYLLPPPQEDKSNLRSKRDVVPDQPQSRYRSDYVHDPDRPKQGPFSTIFVVC